MAWTYRSRRYSSRTVRRSFADAAWLALAIALGIAVVAALARLPPRRQADVGDHLGQLRAAIWPGQALLLALLLRSCPASRLPDYQLTYSQFRVLKCRLQLIRKRRRRSRQLPSRSQSSFARNMGPSNLGDNRSEVFVPVAEESALRQTRWQKVIYPNKITRKLSIGFKPYTLVATLGPSSMRNAQWARTWECNRWMPFNWANTSQYDLNPDGTTASLYMYGPYLVPNSPTGSDASVNGKIYGP